VIRVGLDVHRWLLAPDSAARQRRLSMAADAGIDHLGVGDHVSFHDGTGFDGLVSAAVALATESRLSVEVGVYLLALRHPMTVARQLGTIAEFAPGRLVVGVGAGGEDRREVANCGVDPTTRGRRLDECIQVLRAISTGAPVDHQGRFLELQQARILPAPAPPIRIVVGGRGEAAIRRVAALGDGWIGIFVSARRYREVVAQVAAAAEEIGRPAPGWYGLKVWCAVAPDGEARDLLAQTLESLYRTPFERFERYCPVGTPAEVAEWLLPYVEAGCRNFTLVPVVPSPDAAIAGVAAVRTRLLAMTGALKR
jgi:alkanesulfonate monooxygenase SsuD/methylene tetrahydromethanopterin reductase-like flavin-dependent oxidoreductase (luciferase family)